MPSVVYRSVTENFRDFLSDASGRKAGKQRSSRSNEKYILSGCEAKLDLRNLARAGRERFKSQR